MVDLIDAIELHDRRWRPLPEKSGPDLRSWTDGSDTLLLRHFPIPPDIPAPLSRIDFIWKTARLDGIWGQAAPVDIYTGEIERNEYLVQLVKFSFNGPIGYQGSLIIPKASHSLMFIVAAECSAEDVLERENHAEKVVLRESTDLAEASQRWFVDPFSFPVVTPFGRNRADDDEWDEMYPNHPLSRVRAILRELPTACKVHPDVLHAPAFVGPAPTPETELEIKEAAEFFSVTTAEQTELENLSRSLGEKIGRLISKAGLNSSTEALLVEDPVFAKSDPQDFAAQFENRLPSASQVFANGISELVSEEEEPPLCLVMYSSKRDSTFHTSISAVSAFHAEKHDDPDSFGDAEKIASAEALQFEFIVSRLLRAVNVRCISVRSQEFDKCSTGAALIAANESDWLAKFITACEMSGLIVCSTMFNPNVAKEIGVTFGLERNRAKFLYRSSDGKFHLGSEQEHAFDVRQIPEVWLYVLGKKLGLQVHVEPREH